ncbi:hypothetical protein T492DRAFT_1082468, partial [Pavlovales sp. CCMP2436]
MGPPPQDEGTPGACHVQLCAHCRKPPRAEAPSAPTQPADRYSELYNAHAPPNSIAASADYGQLRTLERLGIMTRPSTLEKLCLATARVHLVVVKIIFYGDQTTRRATWRGSAWFNRCCSLTDLVDVR